MLETEDALERVRLIRNDPWEFLKGVRTLDQVDKRNPIKNFPCDKDYLRLFTRVWQTRRLILVPKSRRMTMSWTCLALIVWECAFHVGQSWALVSKKESDSDELVKRCDFILKNLDHDVIPKDIVPRHETIFGKLTFPEINSNMMGFASGADQLRQFTFSGMMIDEMAFMEDAEKMFAASFPTLEGKGDTPGGKFVGVSSPAPGFFQRLVFDRLDQPDEEMQGDDATL